MTRRQVVSLASTLITLIVVGVLLRLHTQIPHVPVQGEWESAPVVQVCSTAPEWVTESLPAARSYWERLGYETGSVELGDCASLCSVGDEREVPCSEGKILIDLRDQGFDGSHGGETVSPTSADREWATVLAPGAVVVGSDNPADTRTLPEDIQDIMLAHELGHALGFGHATTRVCGPVAGHPTGHIMHPEMHSMGWSSTGIPGEAS